MAKHIYRILVVDDHSIVRTGLSLLLGGEEDLVVCGEAADVESGFKSVEELNPDLILLDLTLKDSNGLQLLKEIRAAGYKMPVLVLSMHDEDLYAERALRAGANGYIMKEQADEFIIEAIRQVLAGELYVSKTISEQMLRGYIHGRNDDADEREEKLLSDRELQVYEMIGQGLSTQKIADRLELSVKTVEAHRAHIKKKLQIDDASELVHRAITWVREGQGRV